MTLGVPMLRWLVLMGRILKTLSSRPKIKSNSSHHAEYNICYAMICDRRLREKLPRHGMTIIVYRYDANGNFTLSRPCMACANMISKNKAIKYVVYFDGEWKRQRVPALLDIAAPLRSHKLYNASANTTFRAARWCCT